VSKVYLVASVLDPRVKLRYFEKNWEANWLFGAREKLHQYLDEFCLAMDIHTMTDSTISNAENDRDESQESQVTFGSWRTVDDDDIGEVKDEWKIYLDAPRVKDYKGFSLHQFWIAQLGLLPNLSRVALETLVIPAMSTEVERVFSGYS